MKFSNAFVENNLIIRKVLARIKHIVRFIKHRKNKNMKLSAFLVGYLNVKNVEKNMTEVMDLVDFVQNIVEWLFVVNMVMQVKVLQKEKDSHLTDHLMELGNVNLVKIIQFLKHVENWKSINENFIQFLKEVHGIKV
jgi:hypothetical protein